MVEEGDWVLIFHSIHKVMKAEKLLKEQRVPMLLIPVPRQLASDCGLAIRLKDEDRETGLARLQEASIVPVEYHRMEQGVYVPVELG